MRNLIIVIALVTGVSVFAQGKRGGAATGGDNVTYKKTTEYSFDDDTIEGDLTKPDGEYVEARKRVKHSNLIKIREEFKDKVMQSVGEL
ncbi:MAG: adventurous gliding motility protein CglF [Myxococcaceae bacterium]|nr:adventurous gliding motility protein CglF [Myxococcaceae bacterium]